MELTLDELRAVTGYALARAERVLPVFEASRSDDHRPRRALDAAAAFAAGGRRTALLRTRAADALRAGRECPDEAAALAALAAGDAAASAYLHPLAHATQVPHLLRSAALAVRVAELTDGASVDEALRDASDAAGPVVREVLRRYPGPPDGGGRTGALVHTLDALLR
ncbi:hypothetical protein GCM10011519_18790 [Marmoricola endophyticus]|uniref:Imm-5-like domain-containing protein n=1 Tax=Marmoricola endophyticus TaxID=2040280 RepID=A0A917F2T6_9ACTN|nr:exonuclease SbcC [Marmoricola endophyticus]GGF45191.1 hypothetical protein GCM10011519_18790 [Marmoricola endophyticus]